MANGRTPEARRRLARLAGAVYVSLGVATLFGIYHAPLVHADLNGLARIVTPSDLRFRIGVVAGVLATALGVPLALLLYESLCTSVNRDRTYRGPSPLRRGEKVPKADEGSHPTEVSRAVDPAGYFRPPKIRSRSGFGGGHVHLCSAGTPASACSTCLPQPAHVAFPHRVHFTW